jgi:hypothetical protein
MEARMQALAMRGIADVRYCTWLARRRVLSWSKAAASAIDIHAIARLNFQRGRTKNRWSPETT